MYPGYILKPHGYIVIHSHHTLFKIVEAFYITQRPDKVLDPVELHGPGANVKVTFLHCADNLRYVHPKCLHGIGIYIDLVFLDKPTNGSYLCHPFRRCEGITNIKILYRSQFLRIPAAGRIPVFIASLQGVPIYLAKCRCIGPQGRCRPFG